MNKYSRYIFYRTAGVFLGLILLFVSLIWFSRAIQFVKFITDYGINLSEFFSLFILILPALSLFIIPIALFSSILIIYSRLIHNNEITILKNVGLKNINIAWPALVLAAICSLICYLISFYLMPYANKKLRLAKLEFQSNYTNLTFAAGNFEIVRNLTIYAKDRFDNELKGILVKDNRYPNYSITMTAETGKIILKPNSALLLMYNGTLQKFNYQNAKSEILHFDSYVFNLNEEHKSEATFHWKPNERYINELIDPEIGTSLEDLKKYRSEIHQRITGPLFSLVLSIIAVGFLLNGQFNRYGNIIHIMGAVLTASIFIALAANLYNLATLSAIYIPLLYLNLFLFSMSGYIIKYSNQIYK